jgi:hypothetical protein
MRRQIPIFIVLIAGVFMAIQYFVPLEQSEWVYEYSLNWVTVIGIFAMALGLWSLTKVTFIRIQRKTPGWGYGLVTMAGLVTMLFLGLVSGSSGIRGNTPFMKLFTNVYTPIQATMFSLLAFYIASAAYRAFRARTVLATILLATALLIMIRLIPLGAVSRYDQVLAGWILSVPNMAAKRAIAIGVGLGATATALKIILGIERSYMGKD